MSVGLIIPSNRRSAPYVEYYVNVLKQNHIDYQLLVWDKRGIAEEADHVFHHPTNDLDRKRMLMGHWQFAHWCRRIIRRKQFDQLIVFTIAPAFMLSSLLLERYRGRFVFDIRDDSPFRRRFPAFLNKLSQAAGLVVTSSPAYMKWIDRKSYLCHNVDLGLLHEHIDDVPATGAAAPIRVVYAGSMIEQKINLEVIEQLKNRSDISLAYIGRSNKCKAELEDHVKVHGIQNVSFQGEYKKEEIADIYRREADLINIFRADTEINRNALPNKLYDAVLSGVPVIVYQHNAEIANYVQTYHLGVVLTGQTKEPLADVILREAERFDYTAYRIGRLQFLKKVETDMQQFEQAIMQLIR